MTDAFESLKRSGIRFEATLEGTRLEFPDAKEAGIPGVPLYRSELAIPQGNLLLSLQPRKGRWFAGLAFKGSGSVEVHVGLRVPMPMGADTYTLIPGAYYDGNNSEPTNNIPALTEKTGMRFEAPASACSTPIAMNYDGKGVVRSLSGAPFTRAGPSGFIVDGRTATVAFMVPALEERRYLHVRFSDRSRPGYSMSDGDALVFWFAYAEERSGSITEMFRLLAERHRGVWGYESRSARPIALDKATDLIADWLLDRHFVVHEDRAPIFLNAFAESAGTVYGRPNFPPDWMQMLGWCSGPMIDFPLLKKGGRYRQAAVRNLDFLVAEGITPCGLAYSLFDGKNWIGDGFWSHVRMSADFVTYLLKAVRLEESGGTQRPTWKAAARRGLDAFCGLWERYGDFGFRIDKAGAEATIAEGGSFAGAFALQALAEGMRSFPGEERYRRVFRAACASYWVRFVARGHCTGGPLDHLRADDSESAAAITDALVTGWLALKDASILSMAEDGAAIFASWVFSYAAPFLPASTLFGRNPCGGVIANVQNRHIGPGICTNSGRFLTELYRATGNELYRRLREDVISAALSFLVLEDGELLGYDRGTGAWFPCRKGMITEQINMTDSLNESGELWAVSAGWPAASILLAWAEGEA